ncbi:MAG: ATP-binding cassette domain-containing protein [Syntrophorhabdaceae bacterium]|nr:ATP-binding cassette domain-containing protein [Syntrophorhabdaceae bacterium]
MKDWTISHPDLPNRLVCEDVSFFVRRGEIVGFAGLMGAGRTELALSIFGRSYGIYKKGQIIKEGRELILKNPAEAIKQGIAYVTEDRKNLGFNHMDDVKTTIVSSALNRISHRGTIDNIKEITVSEDYKKTLRIKTPSVYEKMIHLSGGNQQKVVLSKWLFTEPDLLILDEPTRGIDVGAKFEIYEIIHDFVESGKGVIVISSELPEILGIADRIYVLCDGYITGVLNRTEANQEGLMRLMTAFKSFNLN